jgi:hypothetical protein
LSIVVENGEERRKEKEKKLLKREKEMSKKISSLYRKMGFMHFLLKFLAGFFV